MKKDSQEWKDWCELFEYVKKNVMCYDENMKLPKFMILRLKGLSEGKFIANKKSKPLARYSFKTILITFKLCKNSISNYIMKNNTSFKDEKHKFNGIMVIIENEINNTVLRLSKIKKSEEKTKNLELKHQTNNSATYTKKGNKTKNKLKKLL